MKHVLTICMALSFSYLGASQTILQIEFDGLSPDQYSPFLYKKLADHGLQNPERGFEVKAGVIDMFTTNFVPSQDFDYNYMQYQQKGDAYYENIIHGDPTIGMSSLKSYLNTHYCNDGISLVEIEEYVNFTKDNLDALDPMRAQDLLDATSVFESLPIYGVKAHLVTNSSYQIFNGDVDQNSFYQHEYFSSHHDNHPTIGAHSKGLNYYMDQMSDHYSAISPFVANVHLGWIYTPHDRNMYRHSGKWQKSSFVNHQIYPIGREEANQYILPLFNGNTHFLKNEHGDFRESKQKYDWSIAHGEADAWGYDSRINQIRATVIDKMLSSFPYQKILLSSMYPWSNYLGTKHPSYNTMDQQSALLEPIYHDFYAGNNLNNYPFYSRLLTNDPLKKQRIGYYDGFFGGDTYSHAWTIGNGETQQIHWHTNYFNNPNMSNYIQNLGHDWVDNRMNVDSYLLRKYRQNIWIHGELPTFETTDEACGYYGNLHTSFSAKYRGNFHWLENCNPSLDPIKQYPWELAEKMSDGRLQDGFKSALKMRYFNFTSFNIGHNHLLDTRSPYELKNNQPSTWYQPYPNSELALNTVPNHLQTTVTQWKNDNMDLYNELQAFHMPIADLYFGSNGNQIRSPYEYIRDHLGYRLELQEVELGLGNMSIAVHAKVINRGFAAPQNPRPFYFVLMDYNTNAILQTIESNAEWRNWQPDDFATGLDNQEDPNGYNATSIDNLNKITNTKVGGIPLGDYKDDWHHTPLTIPYTPFEYTFGSLTDFNLSDLPNGDYKIGIWIPDPEEILHNEPKYNVKFANQLSYIHANGVNVIGSVSKTNFGIVQSSDSDADGILNTLDNSPNNPTDYNGGHALSPNHSCFGFSSSQTVQPCNTY